jgi:hypothetical protein
LSDSSAAEPHKREKGTSHPRHTPDPRVMSSGTGTEDLAEKDRPIDPMSGKNSPASPSPNRFEPWQADGRQRFMPQEYLTTLPLKTCPFRFAHARRMRALLSGALRAPFIQQRTYNSRISVLCKAIASILLFGKTLPALIVLAVSGLALNLALSTPPVGR